MPAEDALVKAQAEQDQIEEEARTLAKLTSVFYKQLREEGLGAIIAGKLTQQYLDSLTSCYTRFGDSEYQD